MTDGHKTDDHTKAGTHRLTLRLDMVDYERARFWADKGECSLKEYICEAIDEKNRRSAGEHVGESTLVTNRLGELVDQLAGLSTEVQNLTVTTVRGFDLFTNLSRGDSYLIDEEMDGEL